MGQSSIAFAFVVLLAGGLLLSSTQRSTTDADRALASYQHKGIARDAALTGLNLTIRRLVADVESWQTNPSQYEFHDQSYRGASFSVDVSSPYGATRTVRNCRIDTVDVVATGISGGGQHVIETTYTRSCASDDIPEVFEYGVATGGNLELNGNSRIMARRADINADVHSNQNMIFTQGDPTVEGFGTYLHNYVGGSPSAYFDPNADTNGADPDAWQVADPIVVPPFDAGAQLATATRVHAGDYTVEVDAPETKDFTNWEGLTGYGTEENPFVWYITGNLRIESNFRFIGVGIIIVKGSVFFDGGALYNTPVPPPSTTNADAGREWIADHLSEGNTLGLYIDGNLDGGGPGRIAAQVFVNGNIGYNSVDGFGGNKIYGSLVSRGNTLFDGDPNHLWNVQAKSVVNLFGTPPGEPNSARLLSHVEW